MTETVEISVETLRILYANYDGDTSRHKANLSEAKAVLDAHESGRFSVTFEESSGESVNHQRSEGCVYEDITEPTPSGEANLVRVTELTGKRADEFVVEETGKTVAEHNEGFPSDDPVVIGHYPNMSGDNKEFAFPESRLLVP